MVLRVGALDYKIAFGWSAGSICDGRRRQPWRWRWSGLWCV